MDKLITGYISSHLKISASQAEKVFKKIEPFVDFSEISKKELLK